MEQTEIETEKKEKEEKKENKLAELTKQHRLALIVGNMKGKRINERRTVRKAKSMVTADQIPSYMFKDGQPLTIELTKNKFVALQEGETTTVYQRKRKRTMFLKEHGQQDPDKALTT